MKNLKIVFRLLGLALILIGAVLAVIGNLDELRFFFHNLAIRRVRREEAKVFEE